MSNRPKIKEYFERGDHWDYIADTVLEHINGLVKIDTEGECRATMAFTVTIRVEYTRELSESDKKYSFQKPLKTKPISRLLNH